MFKMLGYNLTLDSVYINSGKMKGWQLDTEVELSSYSHTITAKFADLKLITSID